MKLPDHLPANPRFGGEEQMQRSAKRPTSAATSGLCTRTTSTCTRMRPSYDPTARVLRADGTPSPAWYNAGTQVQSFGLKCNRALGLRKTELARDSPSIQHDGRLPGRAHLRAAVASVGSRGRPAAGRDGAGQGEVRHRVVPVHDGIRTTDLCSARVPITSTGPACATAWKPRSAAARTTRRWSTSTC